ncbi:MAG: hypothetical protein LCH62_09005 [Proteobacteria bacterium]|nr:hypothetical protein [Pseudomonadota bacterium]
MTSTIASTTRFTGSTAHYCQAADPAQRLALLHWADGERQAGLVCADSLHPEKVPGLKDKLAVFDVRGMGCDFKVCGETSNGCCEIEAIPDPTFRDLLCGQFREIVQARQPLLHTIEAQTPQGTWRYSRLSIPLSKRTAEVGRLWLVLAGFEAFRDKVAPVAA